MKELECLLASVKNLTGKKVYSFNKELIEFIQSSPTNAEEIEDWIAYCSENMFLTNDTTLKSFYRVCKLALINSLV